MNSPESLLIFQSGQGVLPARIRHCPAGKITLFCI